MNRNLKTPRTGDRVKVIHVYTGDGNALLHETGKVVYACPPEYEVLLDGLDGRYCFYDGELEVIEQEVNGL